MFKGEVAEPGFGHFRKYRPKFYQTVLALSGVVLYRGTNNVRIIGEMPQFPLSNTQRIPGQDQIDLIENQDILITPCVMEASLPVVLEAIPMTTLDVRAANSSAVFKGTWKANPRGSFSQPNY